MGLFSDHLLWSKFLNTIYIATVNNSRENYIQGEGSLPLVQLLISFLVRYSFDVTAFIFFFSNS